MIDGGGSKAQNYQSHLLHLRALHDILLRAGVPPGLMSLHVSDGADPAPDMAMREAQPEPDFWLLEGSALEGPLRTPVTYENSDVPGAVLSPATRGDIQHWFDTSGRTLRAGDTLLLYVTDHGARGGKTGENAITLWGSGERLPVSELAAMLKTLDPGVRVVALMSQCYSGGFAELANARSTGELPDGSTCGYFSSTADRPAYGCYPENRGRDNVGHSFHFIEALAERGDFPWAHDEVLVRDASPDVPLRTSDTYLEGVLTRAAAAEGSDPDRVHRCAPAPGLDDARGARGGPASARSHRARVRHPRPAVAPRARRPDDAHPRPGRAAPHPEHGLAGSPRIRIARQRRALHRDAPRPGSRASTSRRCAPSRPTTRVRSPPSCSRRSDPRPGPTPASADGSRCCVTAPRNPDRSPTAWTSEPACSSASEPASSRWPVRSIWHDADRPTSGPPTKRCGGART